MSTHIVSAVFSFTLIFCGCSQVYIIYRSITKKKTVHCAVKGSDITYDISISLGWESEGYMKGESGAKDVEEVFLIHGHYISNPEKRRTLSVANKSG